jgi:hypothetical protein
MIIHCMAVSKFKYQINHYISTQPNYMTIDGIHKLLEVYYGISRATFTRDRFLYPGDPEEIPQERLRIYAAILHVSIVELTHANEPEIEYGLAHANLMS